jgi:hypothetical protein
MLSCGRLILFFVLACWSVTAMVGLTLFGWLQVGPGVFSAREFVWWYNGHPGAARLPVDLTGVSSIAIAGIGALLLLECLVQTKILARVQKTALSSWMSPVRLFGQTYLSFSQEPKQPWKYCALV